MMVYHDVLLVWCCDTDAETEIHSVILNMNEKNFLLEQIVPQSQRFIYLDEKTQKHSSIFVNNFHGGKSKRTVSLLEKSFLDH